MVGNDAHPFGMTVAPSPPMDRDVLTLPQRQTLAGFAEEAHGDEGVAFESIEPGDTVVVRTSHSEYRLIVLNRGERTVLARGGGLPGETAAVLQGATAGGNLVRTGWIGIGLRLELSHGNRRLITSRVCSIAVIHS